MHHVMKALTLHHDIEDVTLHLCSQLATDCMIVCLALPKVSAALWRLKSMHAYVW